MALPTLERTWQISSNNVIFDATDYGTCCQLLLRTLKDILIGFDNNPWQVKGSSNSVTSGMDGVDRWSSNSDVVFTASLTSGAKSWVVLENAITGQEMLIASVGSSSTWSRLYVSTSVSGGFTGGSTTTVPSATDEVIHLNRVDGFTSAAETSGPLQQVIHAWHSADGEATRVVICYNSIAVTAIILERAADRVTGWSGIIGDWHYGSNTVNAVMTLGTWSQQDRLQTKFGSTQVPLRVMSLANGNGVFQNNGFPNEVSGEWDFYPHVLNSATIGFRGVHGRLKDLWWGNESAAITNGTTYPADGSRQFVQFVSFIFPWDGSIPQIA